VVTKKRLLIVSKGTGTWDKRTGFGFTVFDIESKNESFMFIEDQDLITSLKLNIMYEQKRLHLLITATDDLYRRFPFFLDLSNFQMMNKEILHLCTERKYEFDTITKAGKLKLILKQKRTEEKEKKKIENQMENYDKELYGIKNHSYPKKQKAKKKEKTINE